MSIKKSMILVVDKEPQTKKMLEIVLPGTHFAIEGCKTGKQAIGLCITLKPDIVLLDLNLPDINGNDVITGLREWSQVPIIVLTARSDNEDIVKALDLGADDYIIKPFNMNVLQARMKASLRKSAIQEAGEPELSNGPLRMNLVRHEVFLDDNLITFTPKEYNLLRYFIVHSGKILCHREILSEIWGAAHTEDTQYLRVFVRQIREKIEKNPASPRIITTELGIGYRMELIQDSCRHRQGEFKF